MVRQGDADHPVLMLRVSESASRIRQSSDGVEPTPNRDFREPCYGTATPQCRTRSHDLGEAGAKKDN